MNPMFFVRSPQTGQSSSEPPNCSTPSAMGDLRNSMFAIASSSPRSNQMAQQEAHLSISTPAIRSRYMGSWQSMHRRDAVRVVIGSPIGFSSCLGTLPSRSRAIHKQMISEQRPAVEVIHTNAVAILANRCSAEAELRLVNVGRGGRAGRLRRLGPKGLLHSHQQAHGHTRRRILQ